LIASLEASKGEQKLQVAEVLSRVGQARAQVAVMDAALGASGALSARIRDEGIPIVVMNKRRGNDPRLTLSLARVFRRLNVDVVHANNWSTLMESVVGARLAGVRSVVHTQHGLHFETGASQPGRNRRFRLVAQRVIAKWLRQIVAVSP
jgi:hypothetical protein